MMIVTMKMTMRKAMLVLGVLMMLVLMGVAAPVSRPSVPDLGSLDLGKKSGPLTLDSNRTPKENFPHVEILGDTSNFTSVLDAVGHGDQPTPTVLTVVTLDQLDHHYYHVGWSQNSSSSSGGQAASPLLHNDNVVSVISLNLTAHRKMDTDPETTPGGGQREEGTTQTDVVAQEMEDDDSALKKTISLAVLVPMCVVLVIFICIALRVGRAQRDEGYALSATIQDPADLMRMSALVSRPYM